MTQQMAFEWPALTPWLWQYSWREPSVMQALRAELATHRLGQMQLAPEQAGFLAWLLGLIGSQRHLEIGAFAGYSALAAALAMPAHGRVITCDVSAEWTQVAQRYWQQAGVGDKVSLYLAPALRTLDVFQLQGMAGYFDSVLIDGDKPNYPAYVEAAYQLTRVGGVIVLDNVLLGGRVALPAKAGDSAGVRRMRQLNVALWHDQRFDVSLLPLGDGMTLLRKRA